MRPLSCVLLVLGPSGGRLWGTQARASPAGSSGRSTAALAWTSVMAVDGASPCRAAMAVPRAGFAGRGTVGRENGWFRPPAPLPQETVPGQVSELRGRIQFPEIWQNFGGKK